jgi:apolipoprotein N-acyltransferase
MWHHFHGVLHAPFGALVGIFVGPAGVFATGVFLFRMLVRRGRYWLALVAFPAIWVSFEYLFNISSPHGTAMSLSYSQLKFLPVLQLASITGPWGISFLILLMPAAVAITLHLWERERTRGARIAAAALGAVSLVLAFGALRLALSPSGGLVKVGLISSDLPQNIDVPEPGPDTERLFRDYVSQAEILASRGAQVIVLPEKLGVLVEPDAHAGDTLFQAVADRTNTIIAAGLIDVFPPRKYNQARLFLPQTRPVTYDKHHLLPPFESTLEPGSTLAILRRPASAWGVQVCKDMDFTQLSRRYGAAGAGLMLVPAWDFDVDRIWHGHKALMRGVESGFSIVRAAKQGYLTVSDNRGRVIAESRSDSSPFVTLIADVPEIHEGTFYILAGDWFAWVSLAMLAVVLARVFMERSNKKGRGQAEMDQLPVVQTAVTPSVTSAGDNCCFACSASHVSDPLEVRTTLLKDRYSLKSVGAAVSADAVARTTVASMTRRSEQRFTPTRAVRRPGAGACAASPRGLIKWIQGTNHPGGRSQRICVFDDFCSEFRRGQKSSTSTQLVE